MAEPHPTIVQIGALSADRIRQWRLAVSDGVMPQIGITTARILSP
jgi:hypothetical protein